jgi:Josephin
MALLYHEKQEAALCGVHCVNTLLQGEDAFVPAAPCSLMHALQHLIACAPLQRISEVRMHEVVCCCSRRSWCCGACLQGPVFSESDLALAAHDLDAMERDLMAAQGVDTSDFAKFAAEDSGNVARDGMFSIQV